AQAVAPDRIRVVDSGTTTMCLGWLAETAARLADEGASPDDAARRVEALAPRLRLYAAIDTLEFLQRGGPIGRAQALAGTLRRLVELVEALPHVERLGVLHGAAPQVAEDLRAALHERFPDVEIETGEIGIVVGTHAGPGVFGVTALAGEGA